MDVIVMESPAGDNSKKREKNRRRTERRKKARARIRNQRHANLEASDKTRDCEVANDNSGKNPVEAVLTAQPFAGNPKIDAGPTETLFEGDAKKKRKRGCKKKMETVQNEAPSVGQMNADAGSAEDPVEGKVTGKRKKKRKRNKKAANEGGPLSIGVTNGDAAPTENLVEGNVAGKSIGVEVHSMGPTNTVAESKENPFEGNVTCKRKNKWKRNKKAATEDGPQSIGQTNGDVASTENLVEGNVASKSIGVEVHSTGQTNRVAESTENVVEENVASKPIGVEVHGMGQTNGDAASTENLVEKVVASKTIGVEVHNMGQTNTVAGSTENRGEGNATVKRKKKRKKIKKEETKNVPNHFVSSDVKDAAGLPLVNAPITSSRRKLLVLDINGLLADIVHPPPKRCRADKVLSGRAIFRRPFYYDFMNFCFQNFNVALWSSRSKAVFQTVVNYLLGDLKHKLLFCWDMSHTTQTGFKTLENRYKPLVCKELRKIWETDGPNSRWKRGDYDESNTLLVDDSPYKAVLNPVHTAIFPRSYTFMDKNDNSLGPGGDIRLYLEGLLTSKNVQKYVEQHPFGQRAINEQHSSWGFYAGVLSRMPNRLNNRTPINPTPHLARGIC